jgi:parafibromin
MASNELQGTDPLTLLRKAIASHALPTPATSSEITSGADADLSLTKATYLHFPVSTASTQKVFDLNTPTRFLSSDKPVDLRSIYFAWLKKDVAIPEYIAAANTLNTELSGAGGLGVKVQNLVFVERLELITWLEGGSDESEYIKPLQTEGGAQQSSAAAQVAAGTVGGVIPVHSGHVSGPGRELDPRLRVIYDGERKIGDRNSILRGIKQTVC